MWDVIASSGPALWGGLRAIPCSCQPFFTHVTLVVPAVLPLLVRVAHAAIAVDMDITWGLEGQSQGGGCWERQADTQFLLTPRGDAAVGVWGTY